MISKNIICTVCPLGCGIDVSLSDKNEILEIRGQGCKRGLSYAQAECLAPARVLTTTVKVEGGGSRLVPVKSDGPLPKDLLLDCMEVIDNVSVKAPVKIGDIVFRNILDTGINIVATKSLN